MTTREERLRIGAMGGKYYETGKFDAGIRSCGCKQKQSFKEANRSGFTTSKHQDFTYGGAEILYESNYNDNNRSKLVLAKCKDCGEGFITTRRHKKTTCGCKKGNRLPIDFELYGTQHNAKSAGERYFEKLLKDLNINYEIQKRFIDCIGDTGTSLPFDFYFIDKNQNQIIVEIDGEQHFKSNKYFGGEEGFLKRKRYDKLKNFYCFNNNINLIRIPDTEISQINKNNFVNKLINFKLTPQNEKEYYESRK